MSELAVITTSLGEMVLEFWPDVAPGHVENFKKLANKGFYNGTCFHRVIKHAECEDFNKCTLCRWNGDRECRPRPVEPLQESVLV